MRIGIIGTRGIPNHYGGFEQFAELLSVYLVKNNHEVVVYNSKSHPYKKNNYKGVTIVHALDPENMVGTVGQFVYDLICILDSRKRNFDIILQLGYTSSSIWSFLFPKKSIVITNMDGMEWKRSKYSSLVKKFLKYAEKIAVKKSDYLISDSKGIQSYLKESYDVESEYIAYGSSVFSSSNENILRDYDISKNKYYLLICRIEPENSVEEIIEGVVNSNSNTPLLVIGDCSTNKYGENLYKKYSTLKKIKFLGSIYNQEVLNNLRFYSQLYFHGHTVGGTNPSLLEAMGCQCVIMANDNQFNKSVLNKDAFYFKTRSDISNFLINFNKEEHKRLLINNLEKIETYYNSNNINKIYELYFKKCLQSK